MKSLRQLSAAVVLTFTLALPALAGEIQIPPRTDPPPPPPSSSVTTDGDMQFPVATTDSVIIALNLLQSMLTLF